MQYTHKHMHRKCISSGSVLDLILTFHRDDTTEEVFEGDPAMTVRVKTFGQLLHLQKER